MLFLLLNQQLARRQVPFCKLDQVYIMGGVDQVFVEHGLLGKTARRVHVRLMRTLLLFLLLYGLYLV